jgi:hypothetical protein
MKRRVIIVAAVTAAVLVGLGVTSQLPSDYDSFREAAVKAAQGSLAGVRSLLLAAEAGRHGNMLPPVLSTVVDDSRTAATTAAQQIGLEDVPDERSAALRDELSPLLTDAIRTIADTARAIDDGDDTQLREALDRLSATGDKLDEFVTRYEQ